MAKPLILEGFRTTLYFGEGIFSYFFLRRLQAVTAPVGSIALLPS